MPIKSQISNFHANRHYQSKSLKLTFNRWKWRDDDWQIKIRKTTLYLCSTCQYCKYFWQGVCRAYCKQSFDLWLWFRILTWAEYYELFISYATKRRNFLNSVRKSNKRMLTKNKKSIHHIFEIVFFFFKKTK